MRHTINIRKYNSQLLNQPESVYCGRSRDKLGLGNPFSHLKNSQAKFKVATLKESLEKYREWLGKLIEAKLSKQTQKLEKWERIYLKKVIKLAREIELGKIETLVCFCVNKDNYKYVKKSPKSCHAEILYGACCYLIRLKNA